MFRMFIFMLALATTEGLAVKISNRSQCRSRECLQQIEKQSRDVLKINWRPISMFPDEANRFK